MLSSFSNSFSSRLYVIVFCFALIMVGFLVHHVYSLHNHMTALKRGELRSIVEAAHNVVGIHHKMAVNGVITEEEAKARARQALRGMRYSEKDYVFALQYNYTNLVHPVKPHVEGTSMKNVKDGRGKFHIQELVGKAKNQGSGFVDYVWKSPAGEEFEKLSYVKAFAPWGWVVGTGVLMVEVNTIFKQAILQGSLLVGVFCILFTIWAFFSARSIANPMRQLHNDIESIAEGNFDKQIANLDRNDRFGEVCRSLAVLKKNTQDRIHLKDRETDEKARQYERQTQLETLINDFQSSMQQSLQDVGSSTDEADTSVEALSRTTQETTANLQKASISSSETQNNLEIIANTATELSASIDDITRQVGDSSTIVQAAVKEAKDSSEQVLLLDTAANKIGQVVTLIREIAEQTNLLALNATIEAARAGDAGKGFAIVASEVKDLATQTSKATEDISLQITAIQSFTKQTVTSIADMTRIMDQVGDSTTSIASAVDQQRVATSEIANSIATASNGTKEAAESLNSVASSAQATDQSVSEVMSSIKNVNARTQDIQTKMHDFLNDVISIQK